MKIFEIFDETPLNKPTPTILDLSKKYKVSIEEIEKQVSIGIKIELEHTNNKEVAKEITLDHLSEDLAYYKKLKKYVE